MHGCQLMEKMENQDDRETLVAKRKGIIKEQVPNQTKTKPSINNPNVKTVETKLMLNFFLGGFFKQKC